MVRLHVVQGEKEARNGRVPGGFSCHCHWHSSGDVHIINGGSSSRVPAPHRSLTAAFVAVAACLAGIVVASAVVSVAFVSGFVAGKRGVPSSLATDAFHRAHQVASSLLPTELPARTIPNLRSTSLVGRHVIGGSPFDPFMQQIRRSITVVTDDLEGRTEQWDSLLRKVDNRVADQDSEFGLAVGDVDANWYAHEVSWATFEFLAFVGLLFSGVVLMFLAAITVQLGQQVRFEDSQPRPRSLVRDTVLRALGATRRRPETERAESQKEPQEAINAIPPFEVRPFEDRPAEVRGAVQETTQMLLPRSSSPESKDDKKEKLNIPTAAVSAGQDSNDGVSAATLTSTCEVWDVRIRQRARTAAAAAIAAAAKSAGPGAENLRLSEAVQRAAAATPATLRRLKALLQSAPARKLPPHAKPMAEMLQKAFSDPEDQRSVQVAVLAAATYVPEARWRFKEATLLTLIKVGADAGAVTALLLHDLDDCLGLPWRQCAKVLHECDAFGEDVVAVIGEKKRLEQLSLLFYLRALGMDWRESLEIPELPAAVQLTRLLYLHRAWDFRAALMEIVEMDQMLRDMSVKSWVSDFDTGAESRALARCALDLHAPIAHGLGLDEIIHSSRSPFDRLNPTFEQLALRLHFPDEYRMIEDWMLQEDELLSRTLRRCLSETRRALEQDGNLTQLATFRVNGRVKSVYSLVKKLLRRRGIARTDLKAEAVKDLLAVEVVVTPDPNLEVPQSPEWLAEEWRERAACFAALDALQRYAQQTSGWWILPGSVKDYITKSKKSGYRALHITLGTNVTAMLPRASSKAFQRQRPDSTMPCKLEVHIFSDNMKQKELAGSASHHMYKAFEVSTEEVVRSLSGNAGGVTPAVLRRVVFPAERLKLQGDAFTPATVDREFADLIAATDRDQDGRLSLTDVQTAQAVVARRLEDFRRALEQQQSRWWVQGVKAAAGVQTSRATGVWGAFPSSLGLREKMSMLEHALRVTKEAHGEQRRKSGDPYWTHPLAVADILARATMQPMPMRGNLQRLEADTPEALELGARAMWPQLCLGTEDILVMYIAALLHDTVEDTSMTIKAIRDIFGPSVASLVDGVTKAECSVKQSRASRSAQDLRKILDRAAYDVRVLVIKFADRMHNMRTLDFMPPNKQRRIAEETRAVFVPLSERLGIHVWKTEFEELCCRYLNGYAYEVLTEVNQQTVIARQRNLRYLEQYFGTLLIDYRDDGSIRDIELAEEPVHTQLRRWATRPNTVPPLPIPRVKVVTSDRDTCWKILGKIHALLPPMPYKLRDYVSSPKENLYLALHTTVIMDGAPVEVYIKSMEMDWVADYGVVAHWRFFEELQRSDLGRVLQRALQSTWLHEATDTIEQSLRTAEAVTNTGESDASANAQLTDIEESSSWEAEKKADQNLIGVGPLLDRVKRVARGRTASMPSVVAAATASAATGSGNKLAQSLSSVEEMMSAGSGTGPGQPTEPAKKMKSKGGIQELGTVHRTYSEVLREKVTVFTPTGRTVYLPVDATALDFAVWRLGNNKGLRAESALIDGLPAPLHTKLTEGQTVLVYFQEEAFDENFVPPRAWASWHLRYMRTARARGALVDARTRLLSDQAARQEGLEALTKELHLQSIEPQLLDELGSEVLAAVGRGVLPEELVSAQLLAERLGIPLGDVGFEYAASDSAQGVGDDAELGAPAGEDVPKQCVLAFLLVAPDRRGLMSDVVEHVKKHNVDLRRLSAEPRGDHLCLLVAAVSVDCALRFGSLLHTLRHWTKPHLLERVPTELDEQAIVAWLARGGASALPLAAGAGTQEDGIEHWKREALEVVRSSVCSPSLTKVSVPAA